MKGAGKEEGAEAEEVMMGVAGREAGGSGLKVRLFDGPVPRWTWI